MNEDFDLEDLLADTGTDDSEVSLGPDLELIKSKLPTYTTQKVAEMVVCSRYLGFEDKITVACMEELSKRRDEGDTFAFEGFIEQSFKALPPLSFNLPDLRSMLTSLTKKGIGSR